jgi:hypothetical protein
MSGKGAEKDAVQITVDELRGILASKNAAHPHKGVRILRAKVKPELPKKVAETPVKALPVEPKPAPAPTPKPAPKPAPKPTPRPAPKTPRPHRNPPPFRHQDLAARQELAAILKEIDKTPWGRAKLALWRRVDALRRIINRNK